MASIGDILNRIRIDYATPRRLKVERIKKVVSLRTDMSPIHDILPIRAALQELADTLQKYRESHDKTSSVRQCGSVCTRQEQKCVNREIWCAKHNTWLNDISTVRQTDEKYESMVQQQIMCESCSDLQTVHNMTCGMGRKACLQTCGQSSQKLLSYTRTYVILSSEKLARYLGYESDWFVHVVWECLHILRNQERLVIFVGILEWFLLGAPFQQIQRDLYEDYQKLRALNIPRR